MRTRSSWILVLALATHSVAVLGQGIGSASAPDYAVRMEQGREALSKADYRQAEALFRAALESVSRTNPADGRYLGAVDALCEVHNQTGQADKCEDLRKSAWAFLVSSLGPQDSVVSNFVTSEVARFLVKHRYSDAEDLLNSAIKACDKLLSDGHPALATYLNNLGTLYYYQGWFAKSEECIRRALEIDEAVHGPSHPAVAEDLHNLAEVYLQTGRPALARSLFERAESIESALDSAHAPSSEASDEQPLTLDHFPTAGIDSYDLALAAIEAGDVEGAVNLFQRALSEADAAGESGTWIENALEQWAALLHQLRRYDNAEPVHKRLITLRENTRGADDPLVAVTLNNLAVVYAVSGRQSDAALCYERALAICSQQTDGDWRQLAMLETNLAGSYRAQRKYLEAERYYHLALARRMDSLGEHTAEVAFTLRALAGVYQDMNKREDAIEVLNRAASIQRSLPNQATADLALTLWPLGELYQYERKFDQAESCYAEILSMEPSTPRIPEMIEGVSQRLATLYGSRGKYALADAMFDSILASLKSSHGPDCLQMGGVLNSKAMFLAEQGRLEEAEPVERHALAVLEKNLGTTDPRLITVLSNFGLILRGVGKNGEADVVEARALQLKLKK